jgi:hypothetical protein
LTLSKGLEVYTPCYDADFVVESEAR